MTEQHTKKRMTNCEHPKECLDEDEECLWCEEVEHLTQHNLALKTVIGKTAIIVHGGNVSIGGDIGMLTMYGGTLNLPTEGHGRATCEARDAVPELVRAVEQWKATPAKPTTEAMSMAVEALELCYNAYAEWPPEMRELPVWKDMVRILHDVLPKLTGKQ